MLDSYGLADVQLVDFLYTSWKRAAKAVELVEPAVLKPRIAAIGLPYTPNGDLTAELIFVGQGEVEDFERLKDQLAGKIVLCLAEGATVPGKKSSHRREKYLRAVEAQAAGFLYVSQNPGQQLVTGSLTAAHAAEIPGVAVSLEDGADLQRMLKRGKVRVRVDVGGTFSSAGTTTPTTSRPGRRTTAPAARSPSRSGGCSRCTGRRWARRCGSS